MTIPKITPYSGGVANPDGSQTQTEFTQNMFGQLSYEAQLATELDATIDGMNQAVTDVESNAAAASASAVAAEASASTAGYQGLWPDTGGSANKGDTYQTQVGGTPTGEYYTALQNTSVDPVGDNVNWKRNGDINRDNLSDYTDLVFDSVADMKSNYLLSGMIVETKSYHGDSVTDVIGAAKYKIMTATEYGGTPDEYGDHTLINGNIAKLTVANNTVCVSCFGAKGDGVFADLPRCQAAVNSGYANVSFPDGVFNFNLADSSNPNVCLTVPKNTIISGMGRNRTTIFGEASANDYNLIANKDWETKSDFTADGNIVVEHLTLDSDIGAQCNLLAFCNAEGLTARHLRYKHHYFHALDFCRSNNLTSHHNEYENTSTNAGAQCLQIDAGSVSGSTVPAGGKNGSDGFNIHHENFKTTESSCIHFHSGVFARNGHIHSNRFNGSALQDNKVIIESDSDVSFDNVVVEKNLVKLTNNTTRFAIMTMTDNPIAVNVVQSPAVFRGVRVNNNVISGATRCVIQAGPISLTRGVYDKCEDIEIKGNKCYLASNATSTLNLFWVTHLKTANISDNEVYMDATVSADSDHNIIFDDNCREITVSRNRYQQTGSMSGLRVIRSTFNDLVSLGVAKIWDIDSNILDALDCKYYIQIADTGVVTGYEYHGAVRRNTMISNPDYSDNGYHLYEGVSISDGTNNLSLVDFGSAAIGSDQFIRQVTSGLKQQLSLPGRKVGSNSNAMCSAFTFNFQVSPDYPLSFNTDGSGFVNSINSAESVGMMTAQVKGADGTFNLLTGADGVMYEIRDDTFAARKLTAAYIKLQVGI